MKNTKLLVIVASVIFVTFLVFWSVLGFKDLRGNSDAAEAFSALYGLMALFGGVLGLVIARRWGGYRSLIGRSVLFISLGLLAQEAGQISYSMYAYLLQQEVPYPSIGDIGYFGSVILYILGAISLIRALSIKTMMQKQTNKIWAGVIPGVILISSYWLFLKDYSFDLNNPLVIFLDFGYPLGQALYISLGLLAYILARRYLGGMMRPVVIFLVLALLVQYAADFTFLYQVSQNTWQTGGNNELIYLTAYYLMTLSLISFGAVIHRLSVRGNRRRE